MTDTTNAPMTLLTYRQAAKLFGVSVRTVTRWTTRRHGALPCVKLGNVVRFRPEDIAALMEKHVMEIREKTREGIPQSWLPPFMKKEASFEEPA
jgi:excisionase family DNA binding protein